MSRTSLMGLLAALLLSVSIASEASAQNTRGPAKFCRFQAGRTISYGILEGEKRVRRLEGDLFGTWRKTDDTFAIEDVKLLVPTTPTQVLAMAGNYKSHLGDGTTTTTVTTVTTITTDPKTGAASSKTSSTAETRVSGTVPELFRTPQPFFKSPSCLAAQGERIVIPADATTVHYEAELVVVIGKTAKNVSRAQAMQYVFGVTCGNDVSERVWQKGDVQWWRAKGADTFGPCGPFIAAGIDYDNLLMQLRLNGEIRQKERTDQLIHDVAGTVSFISRHVTLHPGDLIFTGTPGKTAAIKPGDVVEVEIEGVGILRNPVIGAQSLAASR